MFIAVFIICITFGLIGRSMAKSRNRDAFTWFFICSFFPLIGVIILANLRKIPDDTRPVPRQERESQPQYVEMPLKPEFDKSRWMALVEFDPDVKRAVDRLQPLGSGAVKRFATAYMALNDKTMIDSIAEKIVSEQLERRNRSPEEARERFLNVSGAEFAKRSELLNMSLAIIEQIKRDGMMLFDESVLE